MTSRDVTLGVFWSVLAAIFHAVVPIGVRLLSDRMPPVEIVFFRNAIGLMFFLMLFSWRGLGFVKTANFGLHVQRNLINFGGMWLWFAALGLLPLSKAIALHFTVPIWTTILAIIVLTERPGRRRLIATAIGFCGVLVILRPGAIPIGPAALMVLGSALLYAGVGIYSRVLGRTDDPATTTFYYQIMLSVFALGPALFVWVPPAWADLPALLRILCDPTRLRILALLEREELSVGELTAALDLSQSRVSNHLRVLREAGLVVAERDGKAVLYSLAPRFRAPRRRGALDLGCCLLSFP